MSQRWTLNTKEQLGFFVKHLEERIKEGKRTTVSFSGEGRTVEQNAMLHALIRQIAAQKGDESEVEVKRYVKLHIGVPILRENDEFREAYDRLIKKKFSYEEKLAAMDLIDVTSEMTKEQFGILIDEATRHFAQQGFEVIRAPM